MTFVVDTNIFVSGITQDEFTPKVERLFSALFLPRRINLIAPQLLVAETAHVLLRLHRTRRISLESAKSGYFAALATPSVRPKDEALTMIDLELGLGYAIGGSDLFFVRLARELGAPLVTMDKALRTNAGAVIETLDLDAALCRIGV